jgi:hypothetical protein
MPVSAAIQLVSETDAEVAMTTALLSPGAAAMERIKALVLDSMPFPERRRAYGRALHDFLNWCCERGASGFTKATVNAYRADLEARGLAPSSTPAAPQR